MAMEETTMGYNGWGIVIFLIILFAVFWGGFGNRGTYGMPFNYDGVGYGVGNGFGFQNYKAICDAEKAEIINTARTQFLVEQQGAANRELIAAQTNAINTKIDYYGYQNERDKNSELQRENMELRNKLFVKDQLAPITAQLSSIQCNMLKRPDVYGLGTSCNTIFTPGLNLSGLNKECCNGVVI